MQSSCRVLSTMRKVNRAVKCNILLLIVFAVQCNARIIMKSHSLDNSNEKLIRVLNFIERIGEEKPYETVVLFMDNHQEQLSLDECFITDLLIQLNRFVPVVLINSKTAYEYRAQFNAEILLLRYIAPLRFPMERPEELFPEFKPFPVITNFRVLLLIFDNDRSSLNTEETFQKYCHSMIDHQIINMVAIGSDFFTNYNYLRCRDLRGDAVETMNFYETLQIYEDRLRNMHGHEILILEDWIIPGTMAGINENGDRSLVGYVGEVLNEFARKHNGTLKSIKESEEPKSVYYTVVLNATQSGLIDVGSSLSPVFVWTLNYTTYPYEITSYCLMIPTPPWVPFRDLYKYIFRPFFLTVLIVVAVVFSAMLAYRGPGSDRRSFKLADIIFNDRCFRGMLAQAYPLPRQLNVRIKGILILMAFTSLMVNTTINAHFQTYMTHRPTLPPLRSFDEIALSPYKVLAYREEVEVLNHSTERAIRNYPNIFHWTDEFSYYEDLIESLETRYIFPVRYSRWQVFNERQKLFSRKVYFYSKDLCFFRFALLAFPIRKNSYYRDAFNRITLQMSDSGIQKLLMEWSFYDMVKLKKTSIEDPTEKEEHSVRGTLKIFLHIFVIHFCGMILSTLFFLWERFSWWCCKSPFGGGGRGRQHFKKSVKSKIGFFLLQKKRTRK